MNQHLLKGDELFDNRLGVVTHVVLDTQLIKGCIKALDCEKKSDVYLDYEDLRNSIAAGAVTPKRKGAPKVTTYQNLSDKELEDLAFATNITRRILEYVKTMGVSRHMAYQAIKREYEAKHQGPHFRVLAHCFFSSSSVFIFAGILPLHL